MANDKYSQRTPIETNSTATSPYSNTFAGIEPDEPFTSNAHNGNNRCDTQGKASMDTGARMINTAWLSFNGTGKTVTVSTGPSQPAFDSVLTVFDGAKDPFADAGAFIACNDDVGAKGMDPAMALSQVAVDLRHIDASDVPMSCRSSTTWAAPGLTSRRRPRPSVSAWPSSSRFRAATASSPRSC